MDHAHNTLTSSLRSIVHSSNLECTVVTPIKMVRQSRLRTAPGELGALWLILRTTVALVFVVLTNTARTAPSNGEWPIKGRLSPEKNLPSTQSDNGHPANSLSYPSVQNHNTNRFTTLQGNIYIRSSFAVIHSAHELFFTALLYLRDCRQRCASNRIYIDCQSQVYPPASTFSFFCFSLLRTYE